MCVHPIQLQSMAVGVKVPCGFCLECRKRHARGWAIRCMHEAALHERNCFITLTYADKHLPPYRSLDRRAFPLFMKRLRKEFSHEKMRYYHCGEYGDRSRRPHYHALIFGFDFPDKAEWGVRDGISIWRSGRLEALWPFGYSELGSVTFESAAYAASYVLKKADKVGKKKMWYCDAVTGAMHEIEPEYATMSRGGRVGRGVAHGWYEKYGAEVDRLESVVMAGKVLPVPRYYDELLRERDEAAYQVMKLRRLRKNWKFGPDDRPYEVWLEEKRDAMAREVMARKRLEMIYRRL